jgi:indole-3-glycerol phosphate synthase
MQKTVSQNFTTTAKIKTMNILDKIVADKIKEVTLKKSIIPVSQLENSVLFQRKTFSLTQNLKNSKTAIIAEHKRKSPSKNNINSSFSVQEVVQGYEKAGVCGLSVLTDAKYFGGSLDDLLFARAAVNIPILRKEFIINEYQIIEAKAHGADVILLIAAILSPMEIKIFSELAKNLGLETILEVHDLEEIQRSMFETINIVGINNRNLKTFEVSLDCSKKLVNAIPNQFLKISESGISTPNDVIDLKNHGLQGFLIGENFMKTVNPGQSAKEFIDAIV